MQIGGISLMQLGAAAAARAIGGAGPANTLGDAPPGPRGFADELARLEAYRAERESEMKARYGDTPPDMVAVAMPVDARGYSPFVTADQQRLIDSVTDQYIGRKDINGVMEKLRALGVHPHQIAASAQYWTAPGGVVVDAAGERVRGAYVNILA